MEIPASFFKVSFNKAMAFGYKTEDVDTFVTQAIQHIKDLQEENETLMEKMGVLASSLKQYREEEESLRSALVGAQKLGDSILRDSRSKAEAILRDATARADQVTQDAALELEHTQNNLEHLQAATTEFKERLFSLYRTHLDMINHIPSSKAAAERYHEHTAKKRTAPATAPVPDQEPAEEPLYEEPDEQSPPQEEQYPAQDTLTQEPQESPGQPDYEEQPEYDDYSPRYDDEPDKEPDGDTEPEPEEPYELPPSQGDYPSSDYGNAGYDQESDRDEPVLEYQEEPELDLQTVAQTIPDEDDGTTSYTPRLRNSENTGRRGKAAFEPLAMVQMEFDSMTQEDYEDDEFTEETKKLRSVDLNRIPNFDEEDEEDDLFESQMALKSKHPVSKKFGELKFGETFSLTDD